MAKYSEDLKDKPFENYNEYMQYIFDCVNSVPQALLQASASSASRIFVQCSLTKSCTSFVYAYIAISPKHPQHWR